jgi:hypothetical protein
MATDRIERPAQLMKNGFLEGVCAETGGFPHESRRCFKILHPVFSFEYSMARFPCKLFMLVRQQG